MPELTTEQIREALVGLEVGSLGLRGLTLINRAHLLPAALRDLLAARGQNERLIGVIRRVEWLGYKDDEEGNKHRFCLFCWKYQKQGHSPDCALGNALKEGGR